MSTDVYVTTPGPFWTRRKKKADAVWLGGGEAFTKDGGLTLMKIWIPFSTETKRP